MNPQKFSLRESIVLYSILLGCFAVFCYMDWRYVDVEFLGLARGDEMEHFLELQSIYNGFITLNIKKIFTIGAYNYGFPYYMLNLLAALPFIITENYPLQIYAPRVLNALFSIANLWLLYKIARMYLSARLCVVVIGIFIAMSGFWHQGYIYKPDVFQAFFVLACAYYLLRDNFSFGKHYTLAWIALGLGMGVAKFQAILFIPMIYAYIFLCVREQGFWRSVKRAIVASFGVFAIWILTNPYLLHPRGFNAWYAMFEGNMNSNATNHGAYTQVSLGDKLAMIDFYYFEIIVFIVLLVLCCYLLWLGLVRVFRDLALGEIHKQTIGQNKDSSKDYSASAETMDCHASAVSRNDDKKVDSRIFIQNAEILQSSNSTNAARRQDLGDKNGALQGESRDLPCVVMSADSPQQSPFLAPKPTPKSNQVSLLPFTPIAAGFLVSLIYLLFFVNKAWEAYYFSTMALGILVFSTLGTLRVSKLLGGGGSIAFGAVCPNYRG